jgi:release factor glutamine methyltransferase
VAAVATRIGSETEAKWMVAAAAQLAPGAILSALDSPVSADTVETVTAMADRRAAGEPLQYVIGSWSFRGLEVRVDPRALIPRPETEQVVEVALGELRRLSPVMAGPGSEDSLVAVDLGTGSGVIALSLALEGVDPGPGHPARAGGGLEVWATDTSAPALALAADNLALLARSHAGAAARVRLAEGSWFAALAPGLAGHVHLVVSNPPYVSAAEWSALDPEVRDHEPRPALVPGSSGLESLEILITGARRWLVPGGSLVLELAPHQAVTVRKMAESAGYREIGLRPDLAGRSRTLVARWSGA